MDLAMDLSGALDGADDYYSAEGETSLTADLPVTVNSTGVGLDEQPNYGDERGFFQVVDAPWLWRETA